VVVDASTDGAGAIIGRYLRYQQLHTKLTVVDPENSVFFNAWRDAGRVRCGRAPLVRGY
jgi:cysteine synthase A